MTNHGRLLTQNTDDKQNTINLNNKNMYIENAYERINRDRAEKDLNKLRTKDIYKDIKDNRERDKINAQN
jgi:adenine C2-methylase RlmN of 23S rRNA A2503 and tRNA A37